MTGGVKNSCTAIGECLLSCIKNGYKVVTLISFVYLNKLVTFLMTKSYLPVFLKKKFKEKSLTKINDEF